MYILYIWVCVCVHTCMYVRLYVCRVHTHFNISDSRTFKDLQMSNSRNLSMYSRTLNLQKYTHILEEVHWLNSCMLMIRNIDLYIQIPGLSRTSTKIPGLSRFSRTWANPVCVCMYVCIRPYGRVTSKGNEAKQKMKQLPDIARPGFEPRCYISVANRTTS